MCHSALRTVRASLEQAVDTVAFQNDAKNRDEFTTKLLYLAKNWNTCAAFSCLFTFEQIISKLHVDRHINNLIQA